MIDRTKNITIIMSQEDVHSPNHPDLWYSWVQSLGLPIQTTEMCLTTQKSGIGIVVEPEDIRNPLHPNLWANWMETLGLPATEESVWLYLSELDHN